MGVGILLADKLLFSLLEISKLSNKKKNHSLKNELLQIICKTLCADAIAVYLWDFNANSSFFIKDAYAKIAIDFQDTINLDDCNLPNEPTYLERAKSSMLFLREMGLGKTLFIPFLEDKQVVGVVFIVWMQTQPPGSLEIKEKDVLRIIAQRFYDIYYTYPALHKLKQREADLMKLYMKAEHDLEESRKKISLELHDEVGQVLTSILLQLKLLQQSDDLDYIKGRLGGLHHITSETLAEVRRISQNLRPNILEKLGLQAAVETHVKGFVETTDIDVKLRIHNLNDHQRSLTETQENVVYRAVQEGLTNIARHSDATKSIISLTIKGDNLFLQITDNGKGIKKETEFGTGLLGIKERVSRVNGRFWFYNQGNSGLTLNILIPLK